ncbi:glycoside hydrolase family 43 protein [Ilyomonas limi]|nr:glycoside hydrolase family 43 protein [Ilyomonas limi]
MFIKNTLTFFVLYVLLLAANISCSRQSTPQQSVIHHNPVLDIDFPDPTVINVNSTFYAYATQSEHNGKMVNIQLASSKDLFNWTYIGDALPNKPAWANRTQDFWAPHVLYDTTLHKYVLFFCAKSNDTTTDKGIGVAFADNPEGPFVPKDSPLIVGKGFKDIDPMAMIDPATGKKLLYWGSGFQPIQVQELTNNWTAFKPGSTAVAVVFPHTENNYTNLIEGGWIDVYKGKYYLYYSGDNCCGSKANYAVMVARATNAFGPFERLGEANGKGSSVILEKDSTWLAPGHNSIVADNKGNRWIAYHAIPANKSKTSEDHYIKRVLCIEPLRYVNGWPVVLHTY